MDSMFSQKAAYNSANAKAAGFLAQSQLKQVLTYIQNAAVTLASNRLYSKDYYSYGHTDMLATKLLVPNVLEAGDSSLSVVNWNYVKDADENIVGRTAFVLIPNNVVNIVGNLDIEGGDIYFKDMIRDEIDDD